MLKTEKKKKIIFSPWNVQFLKGKIKNVLIVSNPIKVITEIPQKKKSCHREP